MLSAALLVSTLHDHSEVRTVLSHPLHSRAVVRHHPVPQETPHSRSTVGGGASRDPSPGFRLQTATVSQKPAPVCVHSAAQSRSLSQLPSKGQSPPSAFTRMAYKPEQFYPVGRTPSRAFCPDHHVPKNRRQLPGPAKIYRLFTFQQLLVWVMNVT